jgi:hypothetical protein
MTQNPFKGHIPFPSVVSVITIVVVAVVMMMAMMIAVTYNVLVE